MKELETALAWVAFGQKVIAAGSTAWAAIKAAAAANGIDADNVTLDAVIIDAERRKRLAEQDAGSTSE